MRKEGFQEANMTSKAPFRVMVVDDRAVVRGLLSWAGASVVARDEASNLVKGMPGAVARDGLRAARLPLDEIARRITKLAMRSAA